MKTWPRGWRRRRDEALIALALAALAFVLAASGATWRLDRVVYDSGLALSPRAQPEDIVIVAIDDASVAAIGRWPWSRAVHATLLQRLAAARPRAIALDLVLSEADPDPRQDALLAQTLREAAPVVLPVPWQQIAGQPPRPLEPVEPIRSAVRLAQADPALDADGILRHAFLRAGAAGRPYPHVALALLQAGGQAPSPRIRTQAAPGGAPAAGAWLRDERLLVRFAGPPGHVQRVSYVDVLRGAVPPERLAGRYVLVGMTANGLGDAQATPVSGTGGAMPGIEVIANTLYTLRSGDGLREWPPLALATLSAALVLALVAAFGMLAQRRALALAIGSVALAFAASLAAVAAGWWLSPVPYAAAALLAYPLWSWRRLEAVVRSLDAEIARLAPGPAALPAVTAAGGDPIRARLHTLRDAAGVLRVARRFLSTTLDGMPAAVLVGDAQQRVLLANREAARLFEVDEPAELQGLDLARLLGEFHTPEPMDWPRRLDALPAGAAPLATEAAMRGHGDHVIEVAALDDGEGRRLIVTCADIGLVRQAERQREQALAFVSHDLRSPAASIVMLADLALAGRAGMSHGQLLAEVRRLAQRTLGLAEEFVRAAQVEHQPLQRAPAMLESLVAQALDDLGPQARARGVQLVGEGSCGAPRQVDRALVTRAVANLVGNAIRHSPPGGTVRVRVAGATITVLDEGPGLADAQLERLSSGRAEGVGRTGEVRGLGLGLVFVQRVAERHGGALLAARREPTGTAMTLQLSASGNP